MPTAISVPRSMARSDSRTVMAGLRAASDTGSSWFERARCGSDSLASECTIRGRLSSPTDLTASRWDEILVPRQLVYREKEGEGSAAF